MDNQQTLINFISGQLQQGQHPDVISSQLAQAGWQEDQVKQAFLTVQAQVVPTTMQQPGQVVGGSALTASKPQANGKRRGRIRMGWRLLKHCVSLLNGNKYLLRYYFMTWVMVILINAVFFGIVWFADDGFFDSDAHWYPLLFVAYLVVYCVINFYAAALARNILDIYKGEKQPYSHYLKAARSRFGPIFVYSLISAIIGVLLEYIIERLGKIGEIISWLVGTAWGLATMFSLPIIMDTPASGVGSIKQSWHLFKQTWGEGITAKVTVGTPIALLQILLIFVFSFALFPAIAADSLGMILFIVLVYVFFSVSLAVIGSYASNFINVALYFYATTGQVPPSFDEEMLNSVFIKSKRQIKKEEKLGQVQI